LNNYTAFSKTEVQQAVKPAPSQQYNTGNSAVARRLRRPFSNSIDSTTASGNLLAAMSYTIPPEVVKVARIEENLTQMSYHKYCRQKASGLFEYVFNASGVESTLTRSGSSLTKRAAANF
jgi:hypothetical protein